MESDEVLTNEWINLSDFSHEHDLTLVKRLSQDRCGLSGHDKTILEMCRLSNLRIANGRIFNDKNIGKFTFHESRGSSVVDYLIVDTKAWDLIEDFRVCDISCYSDHCPIEFSIRTHDNNHKNASEETIVQDQSNKDQFKFVKTNETNDILLRLVFDENLTKHFDELSKNLKERKTTNVQKTKTQKTKT